MINWEANLPGPLDLLGGKPPKPHDLLGGKPPKPHDLLGGTMLTIVIVKLKMHLLMVHILKMKTQEITILIH